MSIGSCVFLLGDNYPKKQILATAEGEARSRSSDEKAVAISSGAKRSGSANCNGFLASDSCHPGRYLRLARKFFIVGGLFLINELIPLPNGFLKLRRFGFLLKAGAEDYVSAIATASRKKNNPF